MAKSKSLAIFKELERLYGLIYEEFYPKDPYVVPTFSLQLDKKFAVRLWPDSHHMVIGKGFSQLRTLSELYKAFLHQVVHARNHQKGEISCTANLYHTREFMQEAMNVGFFVIRHQTRGWQMTSFSAHCGSSSEGAIKCETEKVQQRQRFFRKKRLSEVIFQKTKSYIQKEVKKIGPAKRCFLKYTCNCPPPHNSIRSGRRPYGGHPLHVRCLDCNGMFKCEEGEKEEGK